MLNENILNLIREKGKISYPDGIHEDIVLYPNESMKNHTTFHIGGNADCFCEVKSISALQFAQIKKEIEHGFLLNPNIKNVEDVRLWKEGRTMMLYVKVKLADGYILEEKTEVINVNRN